MEAVEIGVGEIIMGLHHTLVPGGLGEPYLGLGTSL